MMPDTLYNVSFCHRDADIRKLVPRIPYSAAQTEDHSIKRVCFTDSIEHCLQAIGPSFRDLHIGADLFVRKVNTSELNPERLMTPQQVFDIGCVPDALFNQEYWYLDEIAITLEHMTITNFSAEHVLNWTIIEKEQVIRILSELAPHILKQISEQTFVEIIDAYHLFCIATQLLDRNKDYDTSDELYDRLSELPWAQAFQIDFVKLKKKGDFS